MSKPYSDAREQSVVEPIARTPAEEAARIMGIEAIGELVNAHGTTRVLAWALTTPPDPQVAAIVEEFGTELVRKWVNYFAWREGRYPTNSLRGQVLSQVKETK